MSTTRPTIGGIDDEPAAVWSVGRFAFVPTLSALLGTDGLAVLAAVPSL